MGQYRQWLHYRELDLKLREQLTEFETALAQLQTQYEGVSEDTPPLYMHNPIVQALVSHQWEQESFSVDEPTHEPVFSSHALIHSKQLPEAMSSALLAWGDLPDFHTPPVENGQTYQGISSTTPATPQNHMTESSASHPELSLLPEDMTPFFDEQGHTQPQIELPWWLRNIINTSRSASGNGSSPIDQESLRTNRLIQRWSERWGRQIPTTPSTGEEENNAHQP